MSFTLIAQNKVSIKGTVYDKETNTPLPDVTVIIGHNGTITDAQGNYSLDNVSKQLTQLKITYVGFETILKKVDLTQLQDYTFDFYLSPTESLLDEVVVTGTRTNKTLRNTPVLTKVISGKDIKRLGNVTAMDAIQEIMPGIQFSPDSHGANMTIQGLDNDYVLVLVNGERMVGETRGNVNLDRIIADNIKKIEVVSGASSVLYGSNAIGGVINIITKDVEKSFQGGVHARYANFNNLNLNLNAGTKQDTYSFSLEAFRNSSDGYDLTPDSPESFTANAYVDYSVSAKAGFQPNKKWDIDAHATFFTHENFNPELSLKSTHELHKNWNMGGKVNYNFNEDHYLTLNASRDLYNAFDVFEEHQDSTAKDADFQYATISLIDKYTISEEWELISGSELNMEKIFSTVLFGTDVSAADQSKTASDFNLFSQVDWKAVKDLELLAGLRYTRHSTFGNHFTPKFSAMYKLNKFRFRLTSALGYKSPSLKELYYNFDHQGAFWIYGNEDLKPETSSYVSLSSEYQKRALNVSLTAYYNMIENKIDMISLFNEENDQLEFHHYNINEVQIKGFESYLDWRFLSHFKFKVGYAFADAKDMSTGLQIYGNSKHTGTTSLTFYTQHSRYPVSVTLSGRLSSPRLFQERVLDENDNFVINKVESDPYSLWKITYIQNIPSWNGISTDLKVGVNNIFDYSNIERSAVLNPGRTFWGGLSVKF